MRSRGNSDKLKLRSIWKTARFKFGFFNDYKLHSEVICLTVCPKVEAEIDWPVVKVIEPISIDSI